MGEYINRKHYVYCTVNKVNGMFYIGKHSTYKMNDNYLGSGVLLKRAIRIYGNDNFKRIILQFTKSSRKAYDLEKRLLLYYLKNKMCYNMNF